MEMKAFVEELPVGVFAEDCVDKRKVDWQVSRKDVGLVAKAVLDVPASAPLEKYQQKEEKEALQLLHQELFLHFVPGQVEMVQASWVSLAQGNCQLHD